MGTLLRFLRWQIGSRVLGMPISAPFVDGTRLLIRTGMRGATMNLYVGLQEFEDMAFTMHFLKPGDLFIDIGSNAGVYTVLATSRGARVLALEPIPSSYEELQDNIALNRISDRVDARNVGVSGEPGKLYFSTNGGPTNHVLVPGESAPDAVAVPVEPLDRLVGRWKPTMLKIDVEGFEAEVMRGATQTLGQRSLQAVLVELNGLGSRYGFKDSDIHACLLASGFTAAQYDPFVRRLKPLKNHQHQGNTLYVRLSEALQERLSYAQPITWRQFRI